MLLLKKVLVYWTMDAEASVSPSIPSTDPAHREDLEATPPLERQIDGQNEDGETSIEVAGYLDVTDEGATEVTGQVVEVAQQQVVVPQGGAPDGGGASDVRGILPATRPRNTGLATVRAGVRSICGRRREMEDAVSVVHNFLSLPSHSDTTPDSSLHFFGVYDGHGGPQAAAHCREHLHMALAAEIRRLGADMAWINEMEHWQTVMTLTFLKMDEEVGSRGTAGSSDQVTWSDTVGSTAVIAVLSDRHIIVANCGDSRAVLCRRGQPVALSEDHKPEKDDERARIEAAGGRVICWNGYRVLGVLAMSRAIGDHFLKPYVIAEPDVTMTERREGEDECLILGSDGLWDVVSNQDACTIARNREAPAAAAAALVHTAHERGSADNISVVVVNLRNAS